MTSVMLVAHLTTQVGMYAFGFKKYRIDMLNMDSERKPAHTSQHIAVAHDYVASAVS